MTATPLDYLLGLPSGSSASRGKLHPADEKALADLFEKAREVVGRLGLGRRTEVVIERTRAGRITGRVTETHFPTEDLEPVCFEAP